MKTLSQTQQHRQTTGEFINRYDKQQGSQQDQEAVIQMLLKTPGRNSTNADKQDLANAMLNIITWLSFVKSTPDTFNTAEAEIIGQENSATNRPAVPPHRTYPPRYLPVRDVVDRIANPTLLDWNSSRPLAKTPTLQKISRQRREAAEIPPIESTTQLPQDAAFTDSQLATALYFEQTKLVDQLLISEGQKASGTHKFSRLNNLINYISENKEERIDKVARLLLSASETYGASIDENISDERKMSVIAEYYHFVIFEMSFEQWWLQQLWKMKTNEHLNFRHENLKRKLINILTLNDNGVELTPKARIFYQDNIMAKLLPTFLLRATAEDRLALNYMEIGDVTWGFIHAGATLLSSTGAEFKSLTLDELAEVGIMMNVLLQENKLPQEFIGYFRLPALFYYARYKQSSSEKPTVIDTKIEQILQDYFAHISDWVKQYNPVMRLLELHNNWKTRPQLASKILEENGLPAEYQTSYLNHDGRSEIELDNGELLILPDVTGEFDKQNQQIELTSREVDKLMLPHAFNTATETAKEWLTNSTINRVRVMFSARHEINGVPLSIPTRLAINDSGALIIQVPEKYDLLQCLKNGQERIYALEMNDEGKYHIFPVDRDKVRISWLLDNFPAGGLDTWELKIEFDERLKNPQDPIDLLIDKLANIHMAKLRIALSELGYDMTTQEKVISFFTSLIPFYSCATEIMQGHRDEALLSCGIDIASFVPFLGHVTRTGVKFGTALTKATSLALIYASRQATMKAALTQATKIFLNQSSAIASKISAKVVQGLALSLARNVDPGFELLSLVGIKGINILSNTLSLIKEKGRGLTQLSASLATVKFPSPPTTLEHSVTFPSIRHGKSLNVVSIGTQNGKPVWVQINEETGNLFGRKYRVNAEGFLEPIHSPLAERLKRIKTEGLGGKRVYADDGAIAGPSEKKVVQSADFILKKEEKNNILMEIRTYGDQDCEELLFPELNKITLRDATIDATKYEQAVAQLSLMEKVALRQWTALEDSHKLSYSDGTPEITNSINLELNEKLTKGIPLTVEEKSTYENLMSVIEGKKLPAVEGDYLLESHYLLNSYIPWLSGDIAINDYVTNYPAFISVTADSDNAINALSDAGGNDELIDAYIVYKFERAHNAVPLLSNALALSNVGDTFIYPPGSIFKVKAIATSQPALPDDIAADKELYKSSRIGVILTEIDAEEVKYITKTKNLFTGTEINFFSITGEPVINLPPYKTLPPVAGNAEYWNYIRRVDNYNYPTVFADIGNTVIQKMDKFTTMPPPSTADINEINEVFVEGINKAYGSHDWRAYAGISGNVPPEIAMLQNKIHNDFEQALIILEDVETKLMYLDYDNILASKTGKYISKMIATDEIDVIKESCRLIEKVVSESRAFLRSAKYVDYSNLVIVCSDLVPLPDELLLQKYQRGPLPDERLKYASALPPEIHKRCPRAIVNAQDEEARIVLFGDKFVVNALTGERLQYVLEPSHVHAENIIHETTHLISSTLDIFKHFRYPDHKISGLRSSALEASGSLLNNLKKESTSADEVNIWDNKLFTYFIGNIKREQGIHVSLSKESIISAIETDKMLFANILLADAEFLTLIISDIFSDLNMDGTLRHKRQAKPSSNNYTQTISDDTANLDWLSPILVMANPRLINWRAKTSPLNIKTLYPTALKKIEIPGGSMDAQYYGETIEDSLLFPEISKLELMQQPLDIDEYKEYISSLEIIDKYVIYGLINFADQNKSPAQKYNIDIKFKKDMPLTPAQEKTYNDTIKFMHNNKRMTVKGDYLRFDNYTFGTHNPWLEDNIEVNDYVTYSPMFLSFSANSKFAEEKMAEANADDTAIDCFVFYKIENATNIFPLIDPYQRGVMTASEFIYPPDTLFKVKSIAVALPAMSTTPDAIVPLHRIRRVAVVLREVDAEEAKSVSMVKDIFSGEPRYF